MLVLSGIHYFLGFHYLYKEIFSYESEEASQNKVAYDETRAFFFAEYDRCNPVTQASATIDFLKYLKSQNPAIASEIGDILKNIEIKKDTVENGALAIKKDQTEGEGIKQGLDIYANQKLDLKEFGQ